MLLIKTYLDRSAIHGIGLFAAEDIAEGTAVWRLIPPLDLLLSIDDFEAIPHEVRARIDKYIYLDRELNKYILCGDDARFFNHSDDPNCGPIEGHVDVALRDIRAGEELLCDYGGFTDEFSLAPGTEDLPRADGARGMAGRR